MQQEKFEIWAIIGLFGHQKLAGKLSERQIAGFNFAMVSIPETKSVPAFDRFINPSAIYDINPCTEEMARGYANQLNVKPIDAFDAREVLRRIDEAKKLNAPARPEIEEEEEEEEHIDEGYGTRIGD